MWNGVFYELFDESTTLKLHPVQASQSLKTDYRNTL
jgi:hypothetical protein